MLQLLNRVRVRLALRTFVRMVALCVVGVAVSATALALLRWLAVPVPEWLIGLPAVGLAMAACVAVSGVLAWQRTPGLVEAARVVERRADLAERLSTSIEFAESSDPLAVALRSDAETRSADLDPRRVVPIMPGRRLTSWLVGCVVVASAAQLLPGSAVRAVDTASAVSPVSVRESATAEGNDFIQQLLDASVQSPSVPPPATRRNALSDSELQASSLQTRSITTDQAPATTGQAATVAAGTASSLEQTATGAVSAQLVDRAADLGGALTAAQPPSSAPAATAPATEVARVDPRNDGTTNPNYNQAAARDQELREHARRRQAGSNPGGGDGDQVAMADAAVAGSATAGFESQGGLDALPSPAEGAKNDLNLPDITDSSGRRVTLERLPDVVMEALPGWLPGTTAWAPGIEPVVTHDVMLLHELELLRRYNTPETGQAP